MSYVCSYFYNKSCYFSSKSRYLTHQISLEEYLDLTKEKSPTEILSERRLVAGLVVRTFLCSLSLPAVFWCHSVGGVFRATHITLNAVGRPPHTRFIAPMRLSMILRHVFMDSYVFFFGSAIFFLLKKITCRPRILICTQSAFIVTVSSFNSWATCQTSESWNRFPVIQYWKDMRVNNGRIFF